MPANDSTGGPFTIGRVIHRCVRRVLIEGTTMTDSMRSVMAYYVSEGQAIGHHATRRGSGRGQPGNQFPVTQIFCGSS
jgi:hypothetical protein